MADKSTTSKASEEQPQKADVPAGEQSSEEKPKWDKATQGEPPADGGDLYEVYDSNAPAAQK